MNRALPISFRFASILLPSALLMSATAAIFATAAQASAPIPPKITYAVTGQGTTGPASHPYFYQDLSFTVYGFENVSPQTIASGVDDIYGFSNSTFEAAGGIVTPASLPSGYTFSDSADFIIDTPFPDRAIFATDPLSGFNLVTDIPGTGNALSLANQPFSLLNKSGGVIAVVTPQPVPEAATGWSLALLLALGGACLRLSARRRPPARSGS